MVLLIGLVGCPNAPAVCEGTFSCDTRACWIRMCGGDFVMGGTGEDELPRHPVHLATFELMQTEASVASYRTCVSAGACPAVNSTVACVWDNDLVAQTCLSWDMASAYCTWMDARLPSESEWEFAATNRGRTQLYPWGDAEPTCDLAVLGCGAPCDGRTRRPCSRPAGTSAQGVCDLAGNAIEWVADGYHPTYAGAPDDGSAWETPPFNWRVMRGGGIGSCAEPKSANRVYHEGEFTYGGAGVRCARDTSSRAAERTTPTTEGPR